MKTKKAKLFYEVILKPTSKDKDLARREYILNLLLSGCLLLALVAFFVSLINYLRLKQDFVGSPPYVLFFFVLLFSVLLIVSRLGHSRFVAYIFITILIIPSLLISLKWGSLLPEPVLMDALIIVITGILINSRIALITTLMISGFLLVVAYLQSNGYLSFETKWFEHVYKFTDAITASVSLGLIALVSWLFNRDTEKTLLRARNSESALRKQRDLLEVKVDQRTKQLRQAQAEKLAQVYRFAEFGRSASGLFHDLANPLNLVSLNLNKLNRNQNQDLVSTKIALERAMVGTKRLEGFIQAARKQIQNQQVSERFSLNKEVTQAIEMLQSRAKGMKVRIEFKSEKNISTIGDPIKFNQLVTNLISNAIDSFDSVKSMTDRLVIIQLRQIAKIVKLEVQDFGSGISKQNLDLIFEPLFTTKGKNKGTGIGLSICKEIVEKDLKGQIGVESTKGLGATFTVEFPLKRT